MISGSLLVILLIFAGIVIVALWYLYRWQWSDKRWQHLYVQGLMAIIERDLSTALKFLREAAIRDTENVNAFILIGDILRERGDTSSALKVHLPLIVRARLKPSQKVRILKSIALDYIKAGRIERALENIQKAIEIAPDKWLYETMIEIYEKLEKWKDARKALDKLASITDNDFSRRNALYLVEEAKKLLELEEYEKSRDMLKDALKLVPDLIPAMITIGDTFAEENNLNEALKWWEKIAFEFPSETLTIIERLENAYYKLGKFDDIFSLYQRILSKDPKNTYVRIRLANLLDKMDKTQDVLELLSNSPEESVSILAPQISALIRSGNYQKASLLAQKIAEKFTNIQYTCSKCGNISDTFAWHCTKCGSWESFKINP